MSMTDFNFDAQLKRAFAEPADPVDLDFTTRVTARVAKVERRRALDHNARTAGIWLAVAAALFGVVSLLTGPAGLDLMATMGLGLAKAHGALSQVEGGVSFGSGLLSLGLTQIMIIGAALAGGVFAVRNARS